MEFKLNNKTFIFRIKILFARIFTSVSILKINYKLQKGVDKNFEFLQMKKGRNSLSKTN